jgi:hypothetical protein
MTYQRAPARALFLVRPAPAVSKRRYGFTYKTGGSPSRGRSGVLGVADTEPAFDSSFGRGCRRSRLWFGASAQGFRRSCGRRRAPAHERGSVGRACDGRQGDLFPCRTGALAGPPGASRVQTPSCFQGDRHSLARQRLPLSAGTARLQIQGRAPRRQLARRPLAALSRLYYERPKLPEASLRRFLTYWASYWPVSDPIDFSGKVLSIHLGEPRPWEHLWLLPPGDEYPAPEFPVKRFPGSRLRHWGDNVETGNISHSTYRLYVAEGATVAEILGHYRDHATRLGHHVEKVGSAELAIENLRPTQTFRKMRVTVRPVQLYWGEPASEETRRALRAGAFPRLATLQGIEVGIR